MPYYAGSRVVTYRTDAYTKAGIKKLPSSLAEYTARLASWREELATKGFSPVYIAGTDWYFAMGFVYDYGGRSPTGGGKWSARSTRRSRSPGLTALQELLPRGLEGEQDHDENHPDPYDVYAQGGAASMIGPSWFNCCVGNTYKRRRRSS